MNKNKYFATVILSKNNVKLDADNIGLFTNKLLDSKIISSIKTQEPDFTILLIDDTTYCSSPKEYDDKNALTIVVSNKQEEYDAIKNVLFYNGELRNIDDILLDGNQVVKIMGTANFILMVLKENLIDQLIILECNLTINSSSIISFDSILAQKYTLIKNNKIPGAKLKVYQKSIN